MKTEIIGKKYNVSNKLEGVITRKIDKFDRYFDDSAKATVVCKEDNKGIYTMELTIRLADNYLIRSEVSTENMYTNIDIILPKIERQIRRYKTRLSNKIKGFDSTTLIYADEEEEEEAPRVVKEKSFELKPISVDEAIAELDLVGNDFFAFFDRDKDRVNIVYRRKNGEIGLIDLVY